MNLPKPFTTHTAEEMQALATKVWRSRTNLQRWKQKVDAIEESHKVLEAELLEAMVASKVESVASKHATVSVKRNTFVELFDDVKFFAYVGKHKAWDLVRKQPVISACQARWEDGEEVAGCRPGTKLGLSITTRNK